MSKHLLLYGGAFNPPHQGHTRNLHAVIESFPEIDEFIVLPCGHPPLPSDKISALATVEHRLAMSRLAFPECKKTRIDPRETTRNTSYTIDTVESFSDGNPIITLLIGEDRLHKFTKWHRWQTILTRCHLIVLKRPGQSQPVSNPELANAIATREVFSKTAWLERVSNHEPSLYRFSQYSLDISSSQIREAIAHHENSFLQHWLHPDVLRYIYKFRLYDFLDKGL